MSFLKKLFASKSQPFVVVSGLPRSGTSMMMKMLEAGGIPPLTDEIREADPDNPRGYYEFERVKQLDKGDSAWLDQAQGKVVKVISALLQHLPADYTYRVIFMERHMPEVLASQRKMLTRRGEESAAVDDAKMAALFNKHLRQVKADLDQQQHLSALFVHYSEVLSDPQGQAERVQRFLGQELAIEQMVNVVDPNLYRNRGEGEAG